MTELALAPDAEQVVSTYLRSRSEIEDLIGSKVYTELPKDPDWPVLKLHRNGGAPVRSRPLHLDAARIQFEAYGGPKKIAHTIAATTRAVLGEAELEEHAGGVITGVEFLPLLWLPDPTFAPAKPRYVFDVIVYLHASPAELSS